MGAMTKAMIAWAIDHHEATGETFFFLDPRFRRAAAQHYRETFGKGAYWVTLLPPLLHEPAGQFAVKIEPVVYDE